jgi:VCBS repeat-containing protein
MANLQVNDAATFEAIVADPPRLTRAGDFRSDRIIGEATVGGETLTFTYFSQPGDRFAGSFPEFRGSIDRLEVTRGDDSLVYRITDITAVGLADLIDVSVERGPGIDALIYAGADRYTASAANDVIDAGLVADIVGTQGITIDGGAGNDTVVLPGRLTDYTIVEGSFAAPDGLVLDGPIGRLALQGVETVTPSQTAPIAALSVTPSGPLTESDEDTVTFTIALDIPPPAGQPVRLQVVPSYDGAGDPQIDLVNPGDGTNNAEIVRDAIATAAAGRNDVSFDTQAGILTLNAPTQTFAFDVTIQDDMQAEDLETLRVSIAAAGADANVDIADGTAAVAIADPDADVVFSLMATPSSIIESPDESATFTLDLDGVPIPAGNTASVTVSRGGATTDDDFSEAPLATFVNAVSNESGASFADDTLTLTSAFDGQLSWTVTPVEDDRIELSDPLTFTLADAAIQDGSAAIAQASASVTVTDAPGLDPEAAFTVSVTPAAIDEEAQESATFTLRLDVPLQAGPPLRDDNTAQVTLVFGGNTEPADLDTPAADALAAAIDAEAGVTRDGNVLSFTNAFDGVLTWRVTADDDANDERTETLSARLSEPTITQGTVTLATVRADLDITDDDVLPPPPPPPPPVNEPPEPVADTITVSEDNTRFITKTELLANDSDPDGDTLSVASVDPAGLTGDLQAADDGFIYDPRAAFQGLAEGRTATDTFTYTVSDGEASASAAVSLTVTGANDTPTAVDDTFATDESSISTGDLFADNGSGADSDIDTGDNFAVTKVDGTSGGVGNQIALASGARVTVEADGTFTYDPNGAFDGLADGETGKDGFTYTITDTVGASDTATVSLTIDGTNTGPVAEPDTAETDEDTPVDIARADLLANDSDPDSTDTLTITAIDTSGLKGTLTDIGDGVLRYDPNGQFEPLADGDETTEKFTYTASDGQAAATGQVTVTVNGANDAPDARDDAVATDEDTMLAGDLFADNGSGADSDIDTGDSFTVTKVDGASGGVGNQIALASGARVTVEAGGTFAYDPNGAFDGLDDGETGKDSFTYTITDTNGASDTATATVEISGRAETTVALSLSPESIAEEEETAPNLARFRLNLDQPIDSGSATIDLAISGTAQVESDYASALPTTVTLTPTDGFGRNIDVTILDQPRFGDNPDDPEPDETLTVSIVSASLPGGIAIDPDKQTATLTIEELDALIDESASNSGGTIPTTGGLEGDDFIVGSAFADNIDAGSGNDDVFAGSGDDTIAGGEGEDIIDAGGDDDEVRAGAGPEGRDDASDDTYDGGEGIDTLRYRFSTEPLTADLDPVEGDATVRGDDIGTDIVRNFERFESGQGNDIITGGPDISYINGFEGDDTISGGAGGQLIIGATGGDEIDAGAGDDVIQAIFDDDDDVFDGGNGDFDRLVYSIGTAVSLTVDLRDAGGSGGTITGPGLGTDRFRNIEAVEGGDGDDTFLAHPSVPRIMGDGGNDRFVFEESAIRDINAVEIQDFDDAGDDAVAIDLFTDGGGANGFIEAFAGTSAFNLVTMGGVVTTVGPGTATAAQVFGTFPSATAFESSLLENITTPTNAVAVAFATGGDRLWAAEIGTTFTTAGGTTNILPTAEIFTVAIAPGGNLDMPGDIILV